MSGWPIPLNNDDMMRPEENKRAKILIVDDEVRERKLLEFLCRGLGHDVIFAKNGSDGVDIAAREQPDLILMDVMMPTMDGFKATERIKASDVTGQTPVIILTSLDEPESRLKGISKGANDYLTKPFDRNELALRIRNNLMIKNYLDLLKDQNKELEKKVAEKTEEIRRAFDQIRGGYIETVRKLNAAAEYKDEETGSHIKRMSTYSKELSLALGMDNEFAETIYYASPMHDIGKVGIPDSIMLKESELSAQEWEIMKSHTTIGAEILGESDSPFLRMAEDIAISHHERWTGTGYPMGLKGEEIPLPGRIVNIVDQYDALRSKRPYKGCLEHEVVVEMIIKGCERSQPADFDPQILDAFNNISARFEEIFNIGSKE